MKTIPPPPPREVIRRHEEKILQEWFDDVEPFNQSEEYYAHEQRGKDVQNKQREAGIARKAVAYRTPEERQRTWKTDVSCTKKQRGILARRICLRAINVLSLILVLVMAHLTLLVPNILSFVCLCTSFFLYESTNTAVIKDICNETKNK